MSVKVLCAKVLVEDTILRLHLLSFQRINAGVNGPRDFLGGRVGVLLTTPKPSWGSLAWSADQLFSHTLLIKLRMNMNVVE